MNGLEWKQQVVSQRLEDAIGIKGLWTAKLDKFFLKIMKMEEGSGFIYLVHGQNRYNGKIPDGISVKTMKAAKKTALLVLQRMIAEAEEFLLEEQKRIILEGENLKNLKNIR